MATRLQTGDTGKKMRDLTTNADGGCPRQHAGIVSGSFISAFPDSLMAMMTDRDSVTAMEERYAIREEGVF